MLYQKSKKEVLEEELFQNPTSEYRAAPFGRGTVNWIKIS